MKDALTIVVFHVSRQQGQPLLDVGQDRPRGEMSFAAPVLSGEAFVSGGYQKVDPRVPAQWDTRVGYKEVLTATVEWLPD